MKTTARDTIPFCAQPQLQVQALTDALRASEEQRCRQMRIVADIGHDLRSPLGRIVGYARLMRRTADDAGDVLQSEHAAVVEREAVHQLALIDEMLEHARAELDELDLQPQATDVAALLEIISAQAHETAARRQSSFLLATGLSAVAWVMVDGARLQQVLMALLVNACAFSRRGTITLAVTSLPDARDTCLRFEVTCRGDVITTTDGARARASFEQAQPTGDDLGLGLLTARRIVQRMGGTLVHAPEEHSRSFGFELRLQPASARNAMPVRDAQSATQRASTVAPSVSRPPADTLQPSVPSLEELGLLAAAGQWSGIEDWLEQAAAAQPECHVFLDRVRSALGNLQFDAISEMASVRR